MKIGYKTHLDFDDVLIKPRKSNITSRKDIDLGVNSTNEFSSYAIPIIAANIDGIGTFSMAKELFKYGLFTCLHKHYTAEEYTTFINGLNKAQKELIFYSLGANESDLEKLKQVYNETGITRVCLDVANAYTPLIPEYTYGIKQIIKNAVLMVGNVATSELFQDFYDAGINIVKIGIGPSTLCQTRHVTGVGVPQFQAIADCAQEAKKYNLKICSDGGARFIGDVCKAFGANASMVMIGSLFGGYEENEGVEWFYENDVKYMKLYGMASKTSMEKHNGGVADYRSSEGREIRVEYKGKVEEFIKQLLGGLRSCCSYVGAATLKELPERCEFIKVNRFHHDKY